MVMLGTVTTPPCCPVGGQRPLHLHGFSSGTLSPAPNAVKRKPVEAGQMDDYSQLQLIYYTIGTKVIELSSNEKLQHFVCWGFPARKISQIKAIVHVSKTAFVSGAWKRTFGFLYGIQADLGVKNSQTTFESSQMSAYGEIRTLIVLCHPATFPMLAPGNQDLEKLGDLVWQPCHRA